ncbi:serine/threonine-protein kinase [Nocardiopsis changdeensis]|uniref:serine/threonine-protein kinase n=1 Tax=Nocardiopsis changdeensis TaxID=2831969 RepID=UPI003F483471
MGSETEPERLLRERYRLTAELGRGGMGRVWKAHDDDLNRTVAVKEILFGPGLSEEERARAAARARREAQAAAMGSHPNIVTVHDVFEEDGRPWIVMEFLTGCSLYELVRREGVRPAHEVARWGLDLLSALDTAHRQGITHRDVKPENVMVTDSGRVVLTDFGIATIADTTAVTQTAGIMGSPAYLPPERLSSGPATPAGDLWSLGATLYLAATGMSPFRREGVPATLNAILHQEPPERLAPGPLREAVHGLLAKDPQRRLDARRCRALLEAGTAPAPAPRAPAATAPAPAAAPQVPPPGTGPQASTAPPAPVGPPPQPGPAAAGTTRQVALTGSFIPPRTAPTLPVQPPPPGAPDGRPRPRADRPAPRGRLSWPVVVLTLGLALVVAGAAVLVVVDPWGAPTGTALSGTGPGDGAPSDDADAADTTAADDATSGTGQTQEEPQEPAHSGMTWTPDPENGFSVLVPDGWIHRVDGTSVFYDSPTDATYLQIDSAEHPTEDEYQHVLDQEQGVIDSGRLPDYRRILVEDVTDRTPFQSAADWEFGWTGDGQQRRVLARNITVSPGVYYTVAWAGLEGDWAGYEDMRAAALDSFAP